MAVFRVDKECSHTAARAGALQTRHGEVLTPVFMPVGTQGTVKAVTPSQLEDLGARMILGNAYHLYLRPGTEVVKAAGGLHSFMGWNGALLTDSGGFQVFSLGNLTKVSDEGVTFRSHIDGSEHFFTPEKVVCIQEALGSDIAMVLDVCTPYPSDWRHNREALDRTHRWAERSLRAHSRVGQALFGIVQGGMFSDLRKESATFLSSLGFPGYGIGGLSVGEPKELTYRMVEEAVAVLPKDKPRYLMGVGSPEDLVECVARGIDMFDSVLPTRVARNGAFFTSRGRRNIRNGVFRTELGPLDPDCDCYTCRTFSAAYVHHLFKSDELLAYTLATIHNLRFVVRLMTNIRQAILDGCFADFKESFLANYALTDQRVRMEQRQKWLQANSL